MQAERKGQVKEELRITSHVLSMMETVIGERKFHVKESNATSEIESTLKEGPKSTLPAHVLTCS